MISSVSLLLTVVGAVAGRDTLPPRPVVDRVRWLIATDWRRDSGEVVLGWGRLPTLPPDAGTAALRLSGHGRDGWYVVTLTPAAGRPVAMTVRAGVRRPMPVATRALRPGATLAPEDMTWSERVDWGAGTDSAAVIDPLGWEVRRSVIAGAVLTAPVVRAPNLVSAGEPVTFVWQRGAVRMERIAVAQTAARLGETVHAQVGGVRLVGRVIGEGTALIEESSE
jgi:flagella basal body P-ring formation protein FlgA